MHTISFFIQVFNKNFTYYFVEDVKSRTRGTHDFTNYEPSRVLNPQYSLFIDVEFELYPSSMNNELHYCMWNRPASYKSFFSTMHTFHKKLKKPNSLTWGTVPINKQACMQIRLHRDLFSSNKHLFFYFFLHCFCK